MVAAAPAVKARLRPPATEDEANARNAAAAEEQARETVRADAMDAALFPPPADDPTPDDDE